MTAKSGNESVGLTGPVVSHGGTAGHLPAGYSVREFQIERVLGEGGFSVVYVATDTRLDRQVAIKEYMPTALATRNSDLSVHVRSSAQHREAFEAGLRSFINEAKLLARFEHRALVKVHQFWQEKGTAYMVMPYYSGPTLKSWIKQQHDPVDPAWLEQFLRLVMDALETLHKENCLHRDVAPDNILILNERTPLLLDFGAARRVIGDLTQALTVILKPGFAPIEQYAESQSMRQGPWTDVYALCAVAHFMITGRAPTPSVTRVLADDLVPLRSVAEGRFSPAFLTALDAGLTVRPQQRPQNIAALRDLMNGAPLDDTLTAPPIDRIAPDAAAPLRPLPRFAEPGDDDDDDRTRIVTTRDLLPRTASNTISSPNKPALAPVEAETAPDVTGDPTFATRFPSRSMREHEAAVTQGRAVEEPEEDRGSKLPLIVGVIAILAVIGAAWAVISWLDAQISQSRRPAPVSAPAPSPAPTTGPVTSPVVVAAAPAPVPAPVIAPPADPTPAPPVTVAAAPVQTESAPAPAAAKPEPLVVEKPALKPAPANPDPAPVAEAKPAPVVTAKPLPAPATKPSAPMPMATAPAPAKSASTPSESRQPMTAASKSGAATGEPMRPRPPSAQPTNAPYSPAPLERASAPPASVPSVATVDAPVPAAVPPPMAALEPSRAAASPSPQAMLRILSRPEPMFPREAIRANVDRGRVMARLFIGPDGSVNKVDIVSAQPVRVFDREVRDTVLRWRFEPPGQPRQTEVEILFDRYKER